MQLIGDFIAPKCRQPLQAQLQDRPRLLAAGASCIIDQPSDLPAALD